MNERTRLESMYQEQLARNMVAEALIQLGLDSGARNYSECRKIYGRWFTDHVKRGDFRAVKEGNRNMYRISEINALRAAELHLAAKHTVEPDII